jgi:DNA invertase Pin-like site-specific DNA recombinase
MKIAYCRVSTHDQSLDLQIDALKAAGCTKFFTEKKSGKNMNDRPELLKALQYCRESDTLVVWKIDRLARSVKDLVDIMSQIEKKGVQFQSLTENIDTNSSTGKLLFGIMSSLSEFQISLTKERVLAGLKSARERGRVGGRPRAINDEKLDQIMRMFKAGIAVKTISQQLNISVPTIYRYMQKESCKT